MVADPGTATFTTDDLADLTRVVAQAWTAGAERDWAVPAGTVEWSCTKTADHAVDCVLAPALALASRFEDRGGSMQWGILSMGPDATPQALVEGLATASRILTAVVVAAEPGARALIWRRPPEVRPAADFLPRGALELILHAHDVCTGLGVPFEPSAELCLHLREHTRSWPHWAMGAWSELAATEDPWGDLLMASHRARQA
jgi:hypothetical protein